MTAHSEVPPVPSRLFIPNRAREPTFRRPRVYANTTRPASRPLCLPAQSEHPVIVAVSDDEVTAGTHADAVGTEDLGGEGIGWNEPVTLLTRAHDGGEGGGFGVEAASKVGCGVGDYEGATTRHGQS